MHFFLTLSGLLATISLELCEKLSECLSLEKFRAVIPAKRNSLIDLEHNTLKPFKSKEYLQRRRKQLKPLAVKKHCSIFFSKEKRNWNWRTDLRGVNCERIHSSTTNVWWIGHCVTAIFYTAVSAYTWTRFYSWHFTARIFVVLSHIHKFGIVGRKWLK